MTPKGAQIFRALEGICPSSEAVGFLKKREVVFLGKGFGFPHFFVLKMAFRGEKCLGIPRASREISFERHVVDSVVLSKVVTKVVVSVCRWWVVCRVRVV